MGEVKYFGSVARISDFSVLDSQFTRCRCRIMYAGRNHNYTDITEDALNKLIVRKGYVNVPVVAHLYKGDDGKWRIGGHDSKFVINSDGFEIVDETIPFGVIPEYCNPAFEEVIETSGEIKKYFCVDIILWTHRYNIMDAVKSDELWFNQSMEININHCYYDRENYCVIDDFDLSALCLLNHDPYNKENEVEPCFPSAGVTKFNWNKVSYNQLKSRYEKAEQQAAYNAHKAKIDKIVKSYDIQLGLTAEYLLYKSNVDYSKTAEQVENDLLFMLGKYVKNGRMPKTQDFSVTCSTLNSSIDETLVKPNMYDNLSSGFTNTLTALCINAVRGKGNVSIYSNGTDDTIRKGFLDILGINDVDKINIHLWNRHSDEIYEVMETTLNMTLPDAWANSPFYQKLVEIKNGALDQKNEFKVKDFSTLIVSRFSGNHWDIDRQKLPANRVFSLATEWYAVMIYDAWERFMRSVTSVVKMFTDISDAFQRSIDERIYSSFNGAGTYLPTKFNESGSFDKKTLLNLAVRVHTAAGRPVHFAGTRQALAKLEGAVDTAWISNEMKNDKNQFGYLITWEGYNTIEIPQTFNSGTYDFKSPDNIIYILPVDYKFIKLWFEGKTRIRELNEQQNHDQTISVQAQTKLGIGVVFDTIFGKYEIL